MGKNMNFKGMAEQFRKKIRQRKGTLGFGLLPDERPTDLKPMIDYLIDDTVALGTDIKEIIQDLNNNQKVINQIQEEIVEIKNELNDLRELMKPATEE